MPSAHIHETVVSPVFHATTDWHYDMKRIGASNEYYQVTEGKRLSLEWERVYRGVKKNLHDYLQPTKKLQKNNLKRNWKKTCKESAKEQPAKKLKTKPAKKLQKKNLQRNCKKTSLFKITFITLKLNM